MTEAYKRIGLSDAEIHNLATAQKKRDYYYRSVKGRRLFRVDLGPAALAFVGMSSEADHRFLDEMVATRPEREFARAMLERRGASGAAQALSYAQPSPQVG
jgi:type IV secretion system protein VirB4